MNLNAYCTTWYLVGQGVKAVAVDPLGVGTDDPPSRIDALQFRVPARGGRCPRPAP